MTSNKKSELHAGLQTAIDLYHQHRRGDAISHLNGVLDDAFKEMGRFALNGKPVRYLDMVVAEQVHPECR